MSHGGTAITGYTVTANPGGLVGTGVASPVLMTGLTNGTGYTFTVTATNAIGTSAASFASNSVTPASVPGAPNIVSATAANTSAAITFIAPASNGGSVITGYSVTSTPGGLTSAGTTSPIIVNGFTNGTAYTFTVTATNAIGTGAASASSSSVTPATVPGAPTIGLAIFRLLALVVAYHLVATTALALLGRLMRWPGVARLAERATLPPFRSAVRRVVGVAISASTILSSAPLLTSTASASVELPSPTTPTTATLRLVGQNQGPPAAEPEPATTATLRQVPPVQADIP